MEKKVADLKLEGVNLIAEGWANNPVCKAYNIQSIPNYVIIDKNGKIALSSAPSPPDLINERKNILDKILSE